MQDSATPNAAIAKVIASGAFIDLCVRKGAILRTAA